MGLVSVTAIGAFGSAGFVIYITAAATHAVVAVVTAILIGEAAIVIIAVAAQGAGGGVGVVIVGCIGIGAELTGYRVIAFCAGITVAAA